MGPESVPECVRTPTSMPECEHVHRGAEATARHGQCLFELLIFHCRMGVDSLPHSLSGGVTYLLEHTAVPGFPRGSGLRPCRKVSSTRCPLSPSCPTPSAGHMARTRQVLVGHRL